MPDNTAGFPGLKGDSGFDRVETYAATVRIPFGVVVGTDTTEGKVKPTATAARGIALHSHAVAQHADGGYPATSAVSVLRRGLAWALVTTGASVTNGNPVYAADTGGTVGNSGTASHTAVPNAVFRSGKITVTVNGTTSDIALVELHNPFV